MHAETILAHWLLLPNLMIIRMILFEYEVLVQLGELFQLEKMNMDQNCIIEENKSDDQQISERKSMDQNCFGMHKPSREGGSGLKIIPPCNQLHKNGSISKNSLFYRLSLFFWTFKCQILSSWALRLLQSSGQVVYCVFLAFWYMRRQSWSKVFPLQHSAATIFL